MIPHVSLITLTMNAKKMLQNLDQSISENCQNTPFEHIVLDNGDDDSDQIPGLVFLRNNRNRGNFSTQNNLAAKYAQGEVLIFLNNDMLAMSDFITDMYTILTRDEGIGIVGACLYYPDKSLQHAGVTIQENLFPANIGRACIEQCNLDLNKVSPSFWGTELRQFPAVTGACLAIRRDDFFKLGGFHEEFHWNFEDVDLCFRMQTHLKKMCVVSPGSVLTHLESQTGTSRHVETYLELLRGRWRGIIRSDIHRFAQDAAASVVKSI